MSEISEKDWIIYCDGNNMQLKSFAGLHKNSYNIILCPSGKEAIEQFRVNIGKIKTVLLDINLPDMSGLDVFDEIKRMSYDIPVILTTADQSEANELSVWRKYRPFSYILKNTSAAPEFIKATLSTAIDGYNQRLAVERFRESETISTVTQKLHKQHEKQIKELQKAAL
ncbi:MAG: hypothetical protein DKM50_05085 [Candidatus Margulisiibacteriota bacterium]|nr:MAG: hypothetical protein A2X43_10755 [Candidatus Margulisbacteria bacterium GWD2_39_127]OGI03398.1 MAG: hypothetical protein A2X42_03400 [Candidatus Margulisbacteria bacterium GWF2_38_17]OGI06567.1 MAG: hypothetical protein A2X41_00480 [Candidatus Margulisbacteria bacterium GWE2_39_32]PZM81910.1 MAG: hypothetical protein DKM50_05085 [Candidatus Margulisiibacteriota bacterium]HAR64083.1 hypothetical protein [Candidatus Margulisiibacteriota bacterium]